MTLQVPRPCLGCRQPTRHGSRCASCAAEYEKGRPFRKERDSAAYRRTTGRALADHRVRHGNLCPGDAAHPAHPTADLTYDHQLALTNGGAVDGPGAVTCRSANSRRGARA